MVLDIEGFRRAGYAAIDSICDYYSTLPEKNVKADVQPGYLLEGLPITAPQQGEAFEAIASDFQSLIMPGITHWQHPKWFAYFPGMTSFESMLGELYASSVSNPGFNWICSPACTELEHVTLDWMAKILGLSSDFLLSSQRGGGIILGSASEAAMTMGIAARENALLHLSGGVVSSDPDAISGISPDIRHQYTSKMVVYGSTQTHSIGKKTAVLLGMRFRALPVTLEDNYALRGSTLKAAMDADSRAGLVPVFVIGTVGTTSSGAVDCIAEIGQVVKKFPTAFLHIDGAWAGVAFALPEFRKELRLAEINEYADSFSTNAHKWGLVNLDCSLLFVRNRRVLTNAMDVTPVYLRYREGDEGTVIDYRNWQMALGRRFRSVKLWFVLRSYGIEGFQRHLMKGIDLAHDLEDMIKETKDFELVTSRRLALVVFRMKPASIVGGNAELNLLNQQLHDQLSVRSDIFLTQTMLHSLETEIFCIRIAIGNLSTDIEDVTATWAIVKEEAQNVMKVWESKAPLPN